MIGQTISHYKITEKLGEGGMGVVYKAEDTKLKRTVTLKFIRTQAMEAAEEKTRFVREAQAAAALDHPNICTIYEIDEVKGKTFIAMAYIKGQSLNIKVKSAPMKLKEVLDIAMQVAQGLQEAHEKGVFHRDIKSSNIMVTEKGQAKIMDFGIAKLTGGTEITRPATFMGTVTYMSPEQASAEPLDHRTDIWSLGVVLYEMLTGQTPFKGEHEQVILHSILNKNPEPITSLRSGIPLEIEAIVNKCLEKDSTERYQTAADLIADLKRLDRDMTTGKTVIPAATVTYPAATAALPRAFLRLLRKIAAPLSGVILVLSLLFLLPSVRQAVKKWLGFKAMPEEMGLAVLPFTIVSGDSEDQAICEGLVEILTSKLTQLERFQESLWVVAASEVRENRITSPSRARRTLGVTLVVTESWQHIGDEVILTLNLIDTKTLRILRSRDIKVPITNISTLQDDVVFRLVDMLDVELKPQTRRVLTAGGTTVPDAYEFYLLGRGYLLRSDNEESLASAIGLFDQAIEKDSSYALAYAGLGEAYWLKWKLTKNQELTKMAQSYCERAIQLSESLAPVRVTLGIIYRDTSKYEDAIKEFKQALLLDPVSFDAHQELALTYQKLGRPEEAEDTYKRAIELKPDYWSGYSHLGVFYLKHARYEEAEEMFRNVTELTPDNPENALGYNNLGASYLYMGRFNDAIAVFKKSIAIHPSPEACSNLGTLYFFQSRYTDAMDMYEKAIDLGKKDYTIWGNLADAYRYIPEYSEKAREAYQRAIQLAEELLAINPRDSELHGKLARYYAILEDHEKALAEISKARELTPSNVRVLFNSILVSELANQRDQAIQALQEYIERGGSMEKVRGDPDLSELRKDPRYKQLIKKEGSGVFDSPKINK